MSDPSAPAQAAGATPTSRHPTARAATVHGVRSWCAANRIVLVVLAVLIIVGGVLRGLEAASPVAAQSADERAYARLTNQFLLHKNFTPPQMEDPVRWGPGAPIAFSLTLRFKPSEREEADVPTAYPAQAAFGTLLIPAVFVLGVLLAGSIVGLLAAGAIALYPPLIIASGDLVTEPLGALLLAVALIGFVLGLRHPSWKLLAATGLLFGITVLVRVDMLAVPLLACLVLAIARWRGAGVRPAARSTGVLLAGILIVLVPWSAYASAVEDKPVLVTSGGMSNLFIGTFTPGDGRLYGVKKYFADEVRAKHPDWRDRHYAMLPSQYVLDVVASRYPDRDREAALFRASLANVRDHILGDPVGFLRMSADKVQRLWWTPSRGSRRVREGWMRIPHIPLLVIGLVGTVLALGLTRGRDAAVWLLVAILLYTTATNMVLVSEARHNLPVMPLLVVLGFAGLGMALRRWTDRQRAKMAASAADAGGHDVPVAPRP